jgi:hypothetical protein
MCRRLCRRRWSHFTSLVWAAQGLRTQPMLERDALIGCLWAIFNLGGVVGSAVAFGSNFNSMVNPSCYIICCAMLINRNQANKMETMQANLLLWCSYAVAVDRTPASHPDWCCFAALPCGSIQDDSQFRTDRTKVTSIYHPFLED